jgi:hypothetical protein
LPGLPDNEVHIVEDGFALMLTREKWDELKECLKTGAEFDLPLKGKSNAHFFTAVGRVSEHKSGCASKVRPMSRKWKRD